MNRLRLAALLPGLFFALCVRAAAGPALVAVIVIDGLPQEQVVKYRDLYGSGGFKRLLEDGAWFGNAHQAHAVTLTGPGHASILTGTYPYRNGIIANEWTDRNTLGQVYCVGDELRHSNNGQSKVIAISGKDRGAIPLAGKRGTAYMYMSTSGRFASSTYYMKEHPAWHTRYYSAKPQDKWMGQSWTLLLPEAAYARSLPEGQSWQHEFAGVGVRFPIALPKGDNPAAFYTALMRTPFGDEATLDFARAAIEGESLGNNPAGVADILAVSLSTHDFVNHGSGPEYSAARGLGGARLNAARLMTDLNAALAARFGIQGNLAPTLSYLLEIRPPAASEGRVLEEILK